MKTSKITCILVTMAGALLFSSCDSTTNAPTSVTDAYLHGRAAWSPDGKTIAFSSLVTNQIGIYVVDTLGGNLKQILSGDGVGVAWSPDARWIVFSKTGSLFKMKPNGDSLTQLTDAIGAIRPSWSRDGSKIAFVESDATGYTSLWLYDVRTATSSLVVSRGYFPSWNAVSGESVVLDAQYDAYSGYTAYAFLAINPTTTVSRIIGTFSTTADAGFCSINSAGTDIVYGILPPTDYAEIYRYNIATNTNFKLTGDGGDYPAWSPNGSEIVYTRTQQGDGGLWIMNADGSGGRRLTKAQ
jgi:Tol biopolymer transport system component